ncbi:hypothetical protein ACJX0J_019575, partial [Zea mays]
NFGFIAAMYFLSGYKKQQIKNRGHEFLSKESPLTIVVYYVFRALYHYQIIDRNQSKIHLGHAMLKIYSQYVIVGTLKLGWDLLALSSYFQG